MIPVQDFISSFNSLIFIIFMLFYAYQFFYIFVVFFRKPKERSPEEVRFHRYAFLIAARNESSVIGNLIDSIKKQDYPSDLIDIVVVADNCTDNTAELCRSLGCTVYERNEPDRIGKGYALDLAFRNMDRDFQDKKIEGVFIFDADNLLTHNYVMEMNKVFDAGYPVVTSYRNSKNYSANWITAGYGLWFLRESKYLNNSRMLLDTSCAVSGTGFVVSTDVIHENNGWNYTLLTEDIEFSVDCAIHGKKIGFAKNAEFFDEQPETFKQSWTQRLRWAKGFYQVFTHYGRNLAGTWLNRFSFSCYDLTMNILPALFISLACILTNFVVLLYALSLPTQNSDLIGITVSSFIVTAFNFYITIFFVGLLTTITEWKKIANCSPARKILYCFTFPLFMFTYVPIAIVALFKRVGWTPISHNVSSNIDQVEGGR